MKTRRGDTETRGHGDNHLRVPASPRPRVWLRLYTKFVAGSTLFLVFVGAMVTSTGSGLAVPDWPLSYGMFFPPMVGNIFYEHGHRMVAATVGFLTLVQAFWLHRAAKRRLVRRLGWISLGAVILQGLLGGMTVLLLLPPAVSISHAALAEIFLCLNVAIAFFTSRFFESFSPSPRLPVSPSLARSAKVLVSMIFLQILIGALMRHMQAGLAIPDFPLSFGRFIPEFTSTAIAVNFAHRVGGVVITLLVLGIAGVALRSPLWRLYMLILAVTGAQIALGGLTVLTQKHAIITSLHVVNGALLLAISLILALVTHIRAPSAERRAPSTLFHDYLELSKARIVLMVLVTTAAGFMLAPSTFDAPLMFHTLFGTALIAAGTNALNQYAERDRDALMNRTRRRPLPDGRMSAAAALRFSIAVSVAGAIWLAVAANWLASFLAVFTLLSYVFIYTPLKTRTSLCTLVGAVPGAIPPMIGWAAASGRIDLGAWFLFGIMFFWQLPHFLAIGWLYREDYARAGFSMLSVADEAGDASGRQALLYGLALLPLSLAPALLGIAGYIYLAVGLVAGAGLIATALNFALKRTRGSARQLFLTSNVYLVVLMSVLVASHVVS